MEVQATAPAQRSGFRPASLDALNFLLADVRGALGPYLNVFLITQRHWSQTDVGLVTTIGGLLGLAVQTPVGAAIDATTAKRAAIVLALAALAAGALVIFALPSFWPVMIANAAMSAVGDVFGPAVGALTLGLYASKHLARRLGRNSAFDHAGNVAIALAAGAVGYFLSQRAVFLLVPAFAALAAAAVLSIPRGAIDDARARGAEPGDAGAQHSGYGILLRSRPLEHDRADRNRSARESCAQTTSERSHAGVSQRAIALVVFGLCTALFHFANAPLLPLVGQKLAQSHPEWATAMMSACIVAAQLVMLPLAVLVGRRADRWGRKPILLVAFAILPVRAVLYTLSDAAPWLIGVQVLDGVGAGLLGAITPLVVADLMRGTGRFNLAQGAIATMQGVGASLSGLAAGIIVDHAGYAAAFLAAAAAAALAVLLLVIAMPETATSTTSSTATAEKPVDAQPTECS